MKNRLYQFRKSGWMIVVLLSMFYESSAITYYSRQTGLWSANTTWSTVTYGNATNTGTYPKAGDVVMIGNGHNISVNLNTTTGSITVGQGISGSLMYSGFSTYLMSVTGNITVNAGATFGYASNSSRLHNLFISGNIINNGNFDVYYDTNDLVNITFNSTTNSTITGAGTWDLNRVNVVKATLTSYYLDVTVSAFETATRDLVIGFGTYIHNNKGTFLVNASLGNFTLTQNAIIKVMSGVMHLSPNADYLWLEGELYVVAGTLRIGRLIGTQGIRYRSNVGKIPAIDVSGGILQVYGGITYRSGYATDPLRYSQSGGSVLLNCGTTGSNAELFRVNNAASSRFTMSAGIITMQKPNGSFGALSDFNLCGTSGVITYSGGTIEFGNASTISGSVFNFTPYAGVVLPDFKVTGAAAASVSLKTSSGSSSNFSLHSLYIGANKTFDIRSITGATGDSKNMTLTSNYDGLNTFYNDGTFVPRTGTVTFQGAEGLWIGGSATTTFYRLTINNSFGLALARNMNISNQLILTDGVLYTTSSEKVTMLAGASSSIGSATSYVDGPFEQIVASASALTINLPIGKNNAYRPILLDVQHSNATAVTYSSETWNSSPRSLSYTLPPTIERVSDVRYFSLTRSAVPNLTSARVTLSYGADDVVTDASNLRVARDNGSSAWLDLGGVGTAVGSGTITSNNFNAFNTMFTFGNSSGGLNPLPVEYASFNAVGTGKSVNVMWSTASEMNSDYFEVEKSTDGTHFQNIGKIDAAGFSTVLHSYLHIDNFPKPGNNYYRLKQVDVDGEFEYSEVKVVNFKKSVMSVFPNPVTDRLISITIDNAGAENVQARLLDVNGKTRWTSEIAIIEGGATRFSVDPSISPGIYTLEIENATENKWHEKLVISQ